MSTVEDEIRAMDRERALQTRLETVQGEYIDTRATLLQAIHVMNENLTAIRNDLKSGRPYAALPKVEYVQRYGKLVYDQFNRRIKEQLEGKKHG